MSDDFEDLYENAPCGYFTAGPDRRIRSVNRVLSQWLGHPPDSLTGEPFTQLFSVGTRIHYETHFAPLLRATGELSGIEVELLTADRRRLPVFLTANLRTTPDGRPDLVRVILHPAGDRHSYEEELLAERQRAERERAQVEVLATTLRRSLLPPMLSPPAGVDAAAYYHPASVHEVGGDFYDLFPLSERRWGLFLGDVCGKGPSAAVITSLTRYTLRAAAVYDADPVTVLHNLDTVLQQRRDAAETSFCTAIFGLLAPIRRRLRHRAGQRGPSARTAVDAPTAPLDMWRPRAGRPSASCRIPLSSPPAFTWRRATRWCSTPTG